MDKEQNKIFIEKFHPEELGFFDLTSFVNVDIGFSVKKKLKEGDDSNVSIFDIHIPNKYLEDKIKSLKPLNVSIHYGKETSEGIVLREEPKLNEPVDVFFPDEYYYDISSGIFYKKDKQILANKIIEETYSEHIKTTKMVSGLKYRTKIYLYRKAFRLFCEYLARAFSVFYKIITGNTYKYGFDNYFSRKRNPSLANDLEIKRKDVEPVNFLGYIAPPQTIFLYSISHLFIFAVLFYIDWKPYILIEIFSNTFLTLVYVMTTLIFFDRLLPGLIKLLIDVLSDLSVKFSYESIKL